MIGYGLKLSEQSGVSFPKEMKSSLSLEQMYLAFGNGTMLRDDSQDLYDFGSKLLEKIVTL